MLAQQWIFRRRMIKAEAGQEFLPSRSRVALFATLFKGALVRVDMAVNASAETHALESRRTTRHVGLMTLFTCHLNMQPSQWITRLGMVELFRGLPIADVVAALAVVSELALVGIGMAREAFLREAEERFAEIFVLDQAALVALNVLRGMALSARDIRVFAFQGVARQFVIELVF